MYHNNAEFIKSNDVKCHTFFPSYELLLLLTDEYFNFSRHFSCFQCMSVISVSVWTVHEIVSEICVLYGKVVLPSHWSPVFIALSLTASKHLYAYEAIVIMGVSCFLSSYQSYSVSSNRGMVRLQWPGWLVISNQCVSNGVRQTVRFCPSHLHGSRYWKYVSCGTI